jgi:hypothetical protein
VESGAKKWRRPGLVFGFQGLDGAGGHSNDDVEWHRRAQPSAIGQRGNLGEKPLSGDMDECE